MDRFIERLSIIEKRYNDLNNLLVSEEVIADIKLTMKYAKEQAGLKETVEAYSKYQETVKNIEEAKLLARDSDLEITQMAEMELETLSSLKEELEEKIKILLLPKDIHDDKDVIVEIRGAAGGDEANIFAGDLCRMYTKYAETVGWKMELLEADESEAGGFSKISFMLSGDDVYSKLKYESGAHRVQRIPATESKGRVHTSTATVLVMPEADDVEIEVKNEDLKVDTYRSSGAGGQHVNTTDSAIRITHLPTGIVVTCQDGRSQHDNRDKAMKLLRAKIYEEKQNEIARERGSEIKSKIGTGDRSEKIRTYNYPQNRVTDHRIGLTLQQLDRIIEGKLDDIIEALITEEQRINLLGLENDN